MSFLPYVSTVLKRTAAFRYPISCTNCGLKPQNNRFSSSFTTKPIHEINTKVAKDVILFKYENPKFFKYVNIFAVVQYIFWAYLGAFAFTSLKNVPVDESKIDEDTPWFRKVNLGEGKYKNTLGAVAVLVGAGSLSMIWMYTLKSVRFLILNKGGEHITLVTYTPFGKNRMMKVPLQYVCCKETRSVAKVQLPLKVKDTWLHYMLDMRGEFTNPTLFDCTAGLGRKW